MVDDALDRLFRTARTHQAWRDAPVSPDQLKALFALFILGPTSSNGLPARFKFCLSEASRTRLAACAYEGNKAKVMAAPVTVIIGYDLAFYEQLDRFFPPNAARVAAALKADPALAETIALRNSALQGAYLIMAARATGLDCGPMSGFDHAAVDAAFFKDIPVKSNFICSLGQGDAGALRPRLPRPEFDEVCEIL